LYKEKVEIILCQNRLVKALEAITYGTPLPEERKGEVIVPISFCVPIRIMQTPRKGSVIIISESSRREPDVNSQLVKAIARSHYWNELLCSEKVSNCKEIKDMEKLKDYSYITEIVNLKFLAPDIVESILDGKQPLGLTMQKLLNIKTLNWQEQRKLVC
jgi:site-specific DNA recombinase